MTQEAHQHHPHHYTGGWRRRMRFWALAVVLCLIGALLSIGIRFLYDRVGRATQPHYEPVDVLPQGISPGRAPENK